MIKMMQDIAATLCLLVIMGFSQAAYAEAMWIDVRSTQEFEAGHVDGAHHIPHTEISEKISGVQSDKSAPIYVYCRSGGRAGVAKASLEALGYTNVTNLGGLDDALKHRDGGH